VITGGEDTGATQAAINFLSNMKEAKRPYEMHSSIRVRTHGYAQALFSGGKNYNPEAGRTTWVIVEDSLDGHLRR
jgi:hypothetical protein